MMNKMRHLMNNIRHLLFVVLYIFIHIGLTLNMIFPLYILKKLKIMRIFKNKISQMISKIIYYFQSVLRVLIYIDNTELYIYHNEINIDTNNKIITIPNHLSELDGLYIGPIYTKILPSQFKTISFVKSNIKYYPIIGWILMACDAIFVINKNKTPDNNQHEYIKKKICKDNYENKNYMIFIEGTIYNKNIKKYREENFNGFNFYKNLMIPKTNGLYLLNKYDDIDYEIYTTIRYLDENDVDISFNETLSLKSLLFGNKPKQVHIMFEQKKNIFKKKDINETMKKKYDDYVYESFRHIDENLTKETLQWEKNYKKTKIYPSLIDIILFVLSIINSYIVIKYLISNKIYMFYVFAVPLLFTIMGFIEHK